MQKYTEQPEAADAELDQMAPLLEHMKVGALEMTTVFVAEHTPWVVSHASNMKLPTPMPFRL